jgi:hypothetical protein
VAVGPSTLDPAAIRVAANGQATDNDLRRYVATLMPAHLGQSLDSFGRRIMKPRIRLLAVVACLYAVTGIGGYYSHADALAAEADERYAFAEKRNRERDANNPLFATGPVTGIDWCAPIMPGVLIANSHQQIGPGFGGGSYKIIVYYGFGSTVLMKGGGWRA